MAKDYGILPYLFKYPISITVALLVPTIYVIHLLFFRIRYPADLPRIYERPGKSSFSLRTRWRYLTDCDTLFRDAYENYAKKGRAVIIPGFGVRDELILPQSSMRWVFAQPENALSVIEAFKEVNQAFYGMRNDKYIADPWQGHIVRTELNGMLENICAALNDELSVAFDEWFGTQSDSWKDLDLFKTIRMVVSQGASRFTVGLPLARDTDYLRKNIEIFDSLIINAGVTGGTPGLLRPIVGRLLSWPNLQKVKQVGLKIEPLYLERLELLKKAKQDPTFREPQDHLQLMMRYAQKNRPDELDSFEDISKRVILANFGSMHQTSILVVNMLLNIVGSDAEYNTIATLREEITRVMGGGDEEWTKAKVAQMIRADSVARETLRLNSFGGRAVIRKVVTDGLVTEDGTRLPKGALISFLGRPAQVDEEKFDEPLKFDPFRFSREREAAADGTGKPGGSNLSFVTTSSEHLPFGHGKHACPGRFIVDFEVKMILAYVLMNYDLKFPADYKGKRPKNIWQAEANCPPDRARLLVKRRA